MKERSWGCLGCCGLVGQVVKWGLCFGGGGGEKLWCWYLGIEEDELRRLGSGGNERECWEVKERSGGGTVHGVVMESVGGI